MPNKILVTYASQTGWTVGIAEEIAKTISQERHQVILMPMNEVAELESYQTIIIGSAVQDRKWLPEAMEFITRNRQILLAKRVAIFTVCLTLAMRNAEKYRSGVVEWIEPVRQLVKPFKEGYFAGGLDLGKIPLKARIQFRISVLFGIWKEGDHRNWPVIQAWAKEIR